MRNGLPVNILVTAVGSELAFSVIKAIQLMGRPVHLVGCDIYQEVVGKHWCDSFHNVPMANDESYIDSIAEIIKNERIQIVIPTSDLELIILSREKASFLDKFECNVLVNSHEEMVRFEDKWGAYQWYLENDVATPITFLGDNLENLKELISKGAISFPLILKPRRGGDHVLFTG